MNASAAATVFTILKIVGGIYLVYLGIQTLRSLRRGVELQCHSQQPQGSAFRQGMLTNLLNP
ncbi:MAG: LysE family translocator, partial [Actinomycetota bacterium]